MKSVYTIAITLWDNKLFATTDIWQTQELHEFLKMTKIIETNCRNAMKSGEIRDYRITRTSHVNYS